MVKVKSYEILVFISLQAREVHRLESVSCAELIIDLLSYDYEVYSSMKSNPGNTCSCYYYSDHS